MQDMIHEECGVFGVMAGQPEELQKTVVVTL